MPYFLKSACKATDCMGIFFPIPALYRGVGGLPLPEFFCALFLLKEKVSSMVATAERVGKVARIGGGVFLANSGNARIETFFLFCTRP